MGIVDFSIVVPFFNKENTIADCIDGLLNQEYPKDRYEIICVDNNSTDGSCRIIEKYPSVILIRENRQGAYIARNAGILIAKGDFIVFSDADVVTPGGWLNNIRMALDKRDLDIVIGWYRPAVDSRILKVHSYLVGERIKISIQRRQPTMVTASASNLVIRKSLFEKEGLFLNVPRSEDKYFVLRCFEKGYNIGFEEKIEVTRNDITSLSVALLKNFTYGYSNALYIDRKFSPVKGISWEILFQCFSVLVGLLLFAFFYYAGYFLGWLKRNTSPSGKYVFLKQTPN